MTLVIAHKTGKQISLSSDSRITFGTAGHIDYGIKIFTVPVKIYSPTRAETNTSDIVYDYKLGLAIVGSAMNSYTVKESVFEILQNLQYIPGYSDLSMDGIASIVFKVFNKTTLDFGQLMQKNGISILVLTGLCPISAKIRVFKFYCDITNYPIEPSYEEILKDDGVEFFGSGKTEAEIIYKDNPALSPLHIIRQVIKEGEVETVGGGLQYGEFEYNNFRIFGVEDYSLNTDGTFKEYLYTLRGINLYKDEFESWDEGFHIAYSFIRPFEREIQQIWRQETSDS